MLNTESIWKRELVALLSLSSWCLVIVVWLFLAVPWVCLQFVFVVFSDHTHYFGLGILALYFSKIPFYLHTIEYDLPLFTIGSQNPMINLNIPTLNQFTFIDGVVFFSRQYRTPKPKEQPR